MKTRLAPLAVCLLPALWVWMTLRDPGLTWDEAIYLGTAVRYSLLLEGPATGDWHDFDFDSASPGFRAKYSNCPRPWTALSPPVIDFFWWQRDHPPLAKLAMGASLRFLYAGGLADLLSAFRLPSALAFAGLLWLVYCFGRDQAGRAAGLFAALSLALMPRIAGHAHLAALDIPITFFWFAVTVAFVKGIESRPWAAVTGLLFGLALLTKINAVLLPLALLPWGALYHRRKCLSNLIAMALIGPMVFFAGWPALWRHPIGRAWEFFQTAFVRAHVPVYYLGTQYVETNPPFHYPLVLTLLTVPLGTALFALMGLGRRVRGIRRDPAVGLVLFQMLVILGVASLPTAPKYDGARLFLPVFPFVAVLSGMGLQRAWERLSARRMRLAVGLAIAYFGLQAGLMLWLHPYELSHYSLLCGGVPGAAKVGMETTYWGEVINRRVLDYMREALPPGSCVEFRHIGERVIAAHKQALGDFPGNIREANSQTDDRYVLLVVRQGMFDATDWEYFRKRKPVWGVSVQGVPLCLIYRAERNR